MIPKELFRAGLKGRGGSVDRTGKLTTWIIQQNGDSESHLLSYQTDHVSAPNCDTHHGCTAITKFVFLGTQ